MILSVTLLYAGLLGILLVALSFNVMRQWVRVTGLGRASDIGLRRAERVLSSFVEYAPIGLILLAFLEISHAPSLVLHVLGTVLVVARLFHAWGSDDVVWAGALRFLGAQMTFLVLTVASFACLYFAYLARLY